VAEFDAILIIMSEEGCFKFTSYNLCIYRDVNVATLWIIMDDFRDIDIISVKNRRFC